MASDFDMDESTDIHVLPSSPREAATLMNEEPSVAGGHFTAVDMGPASTARRLSPSILAASIGLAAMIAAFAYTAYRLSRPYDADSLYNLIHATSDTPTVDLLRTNKDRIDEFVERFPDDPRTRELREYQAELELDRQQRRFATLARGRGEEEGLLTAERLYLSALRKMEVAPTEAAGELQSLLSLFENGAVDQSLTKKQQGRLDACLELARRQAATLDRDLSRQTKADLETLDARLRAAEKLYASDPAAAVAICRAVVDLYQGQAWAAEMVERATTLLKNWE